MILLFIYLNYVLFINIKSKGVKKNFLFFSSLLILFKTYRKKILFKIDYYIQVYTLKIPHKNYF